MTDSNGSHNQWDAMESDDTLDPFLCFPELMTKHQIMRLFKMRYLNPPKDQLISDYEYSNLIALYNRVLLPLPQRKYGTNRKSKELAVKQNDCNNRPKIKRKYEEMCETNDKLKDRPIGQYSSAETNAQQLSNQSHDSKRHKISWP